MAIQTRLEDMVIGDKILSWYNNEASGGNGTIGHFSFNPSNPAEIPKYSWTSGKGRFYFIYVGKDFKGRMILVADRNVQHSISWDKLNEHGISTKDGVQFDLKLDPTQWKTNIRLLTGGTSASNTANSEWDKYIVNGPVGRGDATWNWSGLFSWTSTTQSDSPARRITRGSSSASNRSNAASTWSASNCGFRPVLVAESLVQPIQNKYLFQDGEEIKKYEKTEWVKYEADIFPEHSSPAWLPQRSSWEASGSTISDGILRLNDTGKMSCSYRRNDIVIPENITILKIRIKVAASSNSVNTNNLANLPPSIIIMDGSRRVNLCFTTTKIQELWSGQYFLIDMTEFHEIELVKNGVSGWQVIVDGVKVMEGIAFGSTSSNGLIFSAGGSDGTGDSYWDYVHYNLDGGSSSSGWSTIGVAPATKEMFDKHGLTDLSLIDNEAIQLLDSNDIKVLQYTDEENTSPIVTMSKKMTHDRNLTEGSVFRKRMTLQDYPYGIKQIRGEVT